MIENKVYKSRVDTWLVILFMCVIGFLIWQVIVTNYEWIIVVVTVLMTWLLVDLLLHTDYTIGEGVLKGCTYRQDTEDNALSYDA